VTFNVCFGVFSGVSIFHEILVFSYDFFMSLVVFLVDYGVLVLFYVFTVVYTFFIIC